MVIAVAQKHALAILATGKLESITVHPYVIPDVQMRIVLHQTNVNVGRTMNLILPTKLSVAHIAMTAQTGCAFYQNFAYAIKDI